jgi:spore coat protein A
MSGAVGGAAVLGSGGSFLLTRRASAQRSLRPFVDPLPIPSVIRPANTAPSARPFYQVTMQVFKQQLHRDLPKTTLWGYNGMYPGPTFEARRGQPIDVLWQNNLPNKHMFPIDDTLHGDEPGQPAVRTVVHLHGHKVLPPSDGYPEAWFTNGYQRTGPFFQNKVYTYPNDQQAATLWYHDHALGATRLNNYAGLSGMYILRDDVESGLDLPRGDFEIPLILQDRLFGADGSLVYPVVDTGGDPDPRVPPIWIPEFFGDTVLVNGKVWPFLEVEPRKYRFRMLNASNARFYHLTLVQAAADGSPTGQPGPLFIQIGSDLGLLRRPFPQRALTIGVAERYDVIVDFSGQQGKNFVMLNDAPAPFPDGDDIVVPNVILFKVTRRLSRPDGSSVPALLSQPSLLDPSQAIRTRDLVLSELDSADPFGNPIIGLINARWADPVTEDPRAGTVEIWRLINVTEDAHPIHIHLVHFQVLDRQAFDTSGIDTSVSPPVIPYPLMFTGPRVQPKDEPPARSFLRNDQDALKDTVKSMPGEVTRVIARFDLPAGTAVRRGDRFRYVFHCHILEHEDNDMMRPYDVVG